MTTEEPLAPALTPAIGPRCPFCREQIDKSAAVAVCSSCFQPTHEECWNELGKCVTCQCAEMIAGAATDAGVESQPESGADPTESVDSGDQPDWDNSLRLEQSGTIARHFSMPHTNFKRSLSEIKANLLNCVEIKSSLTAESLKTRVAAAISEQREASYINLGLSALVYAFICGFIAIFANSIKPFIGLDFLTAKQLPIFAGVLLIGAVAVEIVRQLRSMRGLTHYIENYIDSKSTRIVVTEVTSEVLLIETENWFFPGKDAPVPLFERTMSEFEVLIDNLGERSPVLKKPGSGPNSRFLCLPGHDLQPDVGHIVVCYITDGVLTGYDVLTPDYLVRSEQATVTEYRADLLQRAMSHASDQVANRDGTIINGENSANREKLS